METSIRPAFRVALGVAIAIGLLYALAAILSLIGSAVTPSPSAQDALGAPPPTPSALRALFPLALAIPGLLVLFLRKRRGVLPARKGDGLMLLILNAVLAGALVDKPRFVPFTLLVFACAGLWITMVAFHPATKQYLQDRGAES